MKKRKSLILLLAVMLIATLSLSLAACDRDKLDSETRPFSMSIQTPDGVFNPFFSTSAYDGTIVGMTQIGMLSTGKSEGNPDAPYIVYGEEEPTVVLDYTQNYDAGTDRTKYSFVIKNGIKFSDGQPLTIKDVLFNLYVYLDPAYTGSSTIYSTDIVGLTKYRTQEDLDESGASSFELGFIQNASQRIDLLVDYMRSFGRYNPPAGYSVRWDKSTVNYDAAQFKDMVYSTSGTGAEGNLVEMKTNLLEDYIYVRDEFLKELTTDWDSNTNVEEYKDMGFTEKWQIFLLNDGGYDLYLHVNGPDSSYVKDENNNNNLVMDKAHVDQVMREEIMPALLEQEDPEWTWDSDDQLDQDIQAYWATHANERETILRDYCINMVFESYFPKAENEDGFDAITKTNANMFEMVIRYWATAQKVLESWTAEAKTDYYGGKFDVLPCARVEGITVGTTNAYGDRASFTLDIEINGVDPKAIYNFSFTVAPMHIYSNATEIEKFNTAWDSFVASGYTNQDALRGFGVSYSDKDFMDKTVNSSKNVALPVGAGPYMACDADGNTDKAHALNGFYKNFQINFARNEYFETVGTKLSNAKIKYLRYKVVESDQITNALKNGDIDYGDPSAKQEFVDDLKGAGLETVLTKTSGYGYVGINPRFVPNINVRRAIIMAMNVKMTKENYYQDLADVLMRPMSNTNWASPEYGNKQGTVGDYIVPETQDNYAYDGSGDKIRKLLSDAGYSLNSAGVMHKNIDGFGDDVLDYKFTIAGGTSDHPAYAMFLNAARILNQCGFNVRVVCSNNALTDLSAGKLAVWAAAWGSTIDPDMYQVYHMQSNASSVNNWGYKQILANQKLYATEYQIITDLSKKIDEARETTNKQERTDLYAEALDLVMKLAVEFPTYQRRDLAAYNPKVLDANTMPPEKDCGPYYGLLSRIWEVDYRH